jgi:heat shock protein HslJ
VLGISLSATGVDELTPETLRNLTYRGVLDYPVTLQDGVFEGSSLVIGGASRPRVELLDRLHLIDDLDGDGVSEAIVLLSESSGGSGTRTFVSAVTHTAGKTHNLDTLLVGDRVQIRSLRATGGGLMIDYVAAGPDDPACCPTVKTRSHYRLAAGRLIEGTTETFGTLTADDLRGVTWLLTHLDRAQPVPPGLAMNAVFEEGRLTGTGGCNRFFTEIRLSRARDLAFGPIGATRMACPEPAASAESAYLERLGQVDGFGFLLGQLVLTYRAGDRLGLLLFDADSGATATDSWGG